MGPEQRQSLPVVTTVIKQDASTASLGSFSKLLENHRGLTQHQIMVICSGGFTLGTWSVRYMPDQAGVNGTIDTGQDLDVSGKDSDELKFSALLRGIHIQEETAPDSGGGETVTFIISSVRGQLINS